MENLNLKSVLKTIKLNENSISVVLGVLVVIATGMLLVNYLKMRSGSLPADTNNQAALQTTIHKVSKGDNLWAIAEKYYGDGFKWVEIAKANKIESPNTLEVDQVLSLPNVEAGVEATSSASVKLTGTPTLVKTTGNFVKSSEPISGATYTVVKGDNLWTIAVRAYGDGYQWTKIAKENKLVHPGIIHPGNTLSLPR